MSDTTDANPYTPVVLTDCYDPLEASAIVSALEDAGVVALVDGELVSFNQVELANPPLIRVATADLQRAHEILHGWRDAVAQRRSDRLGDQNSPHDPTTNDDVYQDYHGEDGILWDRYGRPSQIVYAVFTMLILCGLGALLLSWTR